MGFILLIPLLILMYAVLIRPQQQRVRQQRALITSIDVDDEVVTAGGIVGRIVELTDDRVFLEIADDVVIEVLRIAITRKLDEHEYSQPAVDDTNDTETEAEAGEPAGDEHIASDDHIASDEHHEHDEHGH